MSNLQAHIINDETGEEATLEEQLDAARELWAEVQRLTMEAWKITPQFVLSHDRMTVRRQMKNVNLVQEGSSKLAATCSEALGSLRRNRKAREEGLQWAFETDQEAAEMGARRVA